MAMNSFVKKVFSKSLNLNMTWLAVIIFAVLTGVYTGLINEVKFLRDTSFQDIAISHEWWILFAMLIIVNQKNWWNSGLKTFVFFIISQTVIFLVETPFEGFYYAYWIHWMNIALLTLPAGCVMWFVKKNNFFSSFLLSLPLTLLILEALTELIKYLSPIIFPNSNYDVTYHLHILTILFCLLQFLFWLFAQSKDKKHIIVTSIFVLVLSVIGYYVMIY